MTAPPLPPIPARHRLAAAIVEALHDPRARQILADLARDDTAVRDWLGPDADPRGAVQARARRASATVATAVLGLGPATLAAALDDAALLFDAGLFFETHEVLEPHWRQASLSEREALQGLIQIAVGYQHRVNGNARGARSLLADGVARVRGRRLRGMGLDSFAAAVARTIGPEGEEGGSPAAPPFPRPLARGPGRPPPS